MKRAVSLLLVVFFCLYFYFSWEETVSNDGENHDREQYFTSRNKKGRLKGRVLIYAATKNGGTVMGQRHLWQCSQEVKDYCTISSNLSDRPLADAVFYHNRDFRSDHLMQGNRSPYQVHVVSTWESPSHETLSYPPDYINWTMTYRKDSDVWDPYNRLIPKKSNLSLDLEALWSQKIPNLTATWIASNCHAKNGRKELVYKAASHDPGIKLFGKCGTAELPNCGRNSLNIYDCAGQVAKHYYFYFAFENSNCQDYVTEKFYNALMWTTVPVVIKRKIYTDLGIPGEMFIAVDDFGSIKEMVEYLKELKTDKQRYLEYHKWRRKLELSQLGDDIGLCSLCHKLRNPMETWKSYPAVGSWFAGTCDNRFALRYL